MYLVSSITHWMLLMLKLREFCIKYLNEVAEVLNWFLVKNARLTSSSVFGMKILNFWENFHMIKVEILNPSFYFTLVEKMEKCVLVMRIS